MAVVRRKKLVTTKEVTKMLKVSSEVITCLRQNDGLPFVRNSKYILFSEPEVIRWRNQQLINDAKSVLNLKEYYDTIRLNRFVPYDEFKAKVREIAFLDGDSVIQYLKRQSPLKDIQNLVGDIVSEHWNSFKPRCSKCGNVIVSSLDKGLCASCKPRIKGKGLLQ